MLLRKSDEYAIEEILSIESLSVTLLRFFYRSPYFGTHKSFQYAYCIGETIKSNNQVASTVQCPRP